ncbi:MAG: glutathione S-transferase family protein [Vitreoscilla sp.]|jgi:glutathione S-transferase|nr:glutathione S-transferase family protein [Vitreoscilla sp.]
MKFYMLSGACSIVGNVALEWAGAEFELVKLDFAATKTPEFLAKNPQGSVPFLEDGDFTLSQNTAILQYIADKYPQAHLFGKGNAEQQAKAHQWLGMVNADIHSKFSILFGPQRFAESEAAQAEVVAAAKKLLQGLFAAVDTHLNGRKYLADELTIADVYLLVVLNWAAYKEVDLSACKNLQALHARVVADAAVAKVLAQQ